MRVESELGSMFWIKRFISESSRVRLMRLILLATATALPVMRAESEAEAVVLWPVSAMAEVVDFT